MSCSFHISISQKSVNLWLPFGLAFYFKHFNPSTISSHCLHFAFLVKTGEGRLPLLKISMTLWRSFRCTCTMANLRSNPKFPIFLCRLHVLHLQKDTNPLTAVLLCKFSGSRCIGVLSYRTSFLLWPHYGNTLCLTPHEFPASN